MKRVTVLSLVLGLAMLGGGNIASAATYGPVTSDGYAQSLLSEDGDFEDSNDDVSDNFFGATDWTDISNELSFTGDLRSGTWSIDSSLWDTYQAITLVLKDGRTGRPPNGIFYTAWLLVEGSISGTWAMPDKDLSHMSLYGSNINIGGDEPPAVPVPAAVWLFGSGLLGLIGAARKKSAAA
ncbi:MAG: hypothetical protein M8364_18955 [Methylobacter sp.]|uniref:hypothetical protein n=1 Tax=Methylobacter TaxID=429 RepID=UPI000370D534|nr:MULTISPECIES: hypothetical protein [Methylobacter]MCL7422975.1 hypothetical protein [Methylobacter sp.]